MTSLAVVLAPLDNVPSEGRIVARANARAAVASDPDIAVATETGYPDVRLGLRQGAVGYAWHSGGPLQSVSAAVKDGLDAEVQVLKGAGSPMIPGVCRRRDIVAIRVPRLGRPVWVLGVHTAPLRRDLRGRVAAVASQRRAARRIRRFAKNHPRALVAAVGDFNTKQLIPEARRVGRPGIVHAELLGDWGRVVTSPVKLDSDHQGTRFLLEIGGRA